MAGTPNGSGGGAQSSPGGIPSSNSGQSSNPLPPTINATSASASSAALPSPIAPIQASFATPSGTSMHGGSAISSNGVPKIGASPPKSGNTIRKSVAKARANGLSLPAAVASSSSRSQYGGGAFKSDDMMDSIYDVLNSSATFSPSNKNLEELLHDVEPMPFAVKSPTKRGHGADVPVPSYLGSSRGGGNFDIATSLHQMSLDEDHDALHDLMDTPFVHPGDLGLWNPKASAASLSSLPRKGSPVPPVPVSRSPRSSTLATFKSSLDGSMFRASMDSSNGDALLGRMDDLESFTHSLSSPLNFNVLPSLSPAGQQLHKINGFFREGHITAEQKAAMKEQVLRGEEL